MLAYFRTPVGWTELARRTVTDSLEDGVPALAAQLAFYFVLALFPALLFLLALLSYLPVEPALGTALARLETLVPVDVLVILREQIDQALAGERGGLMTFAMLGAIWSSSTAMTAIISALNHAYDVQEFRRWWHTRLTAIWLTLALAAFTVVAFALVIGGVDLARWVASLVGAGDVFAAIWAVAQWPIALVLVIVAVDLVYHVGPNVELQWAWVTPGSLLATALWLLASIGFKIYLQNFSSYTAVYGAIGSIIVLMLWFYMSGLALLVGAELNAEIDKAQPSRQGGERGATGSSRVGGGGRRPRA
jgi:membrane protein